VDVSSLRRLDPADPTVAAALQTCRAQLAPSTAGNQLAPPGGGPAGAASGTAGTTT
jgi:hypothetical protein